MRRFHALLPAAVGLALLWTAAAGRYEVVVRAETGALLGRIPVSAGSPVVLEYTNSLYLAPTQEHFAVHSAGFALREVWSTSDAVLAASSLPAPYVRRGAFFVSSVHAFVPRIVTRVGPVGQQRLRVGGRDVPLYAAGTGAGVVVALRRSPPPETFLRLLGR
jgi:hypothetical protein